MQRAVASTPRARYAYVYAVALNSAGRGDEAMTVLKESLARHPGDRDTLSALVSFSRDARDFQAALGFAERLAVIAPGDISLHALHQQSSTSNQQSGRTIRRPFYGSCANLTRICPDILLADREMEAAASSRITGDNRTGVRLTCRGFAMADVAPLELAAELALAARTCSLPRLSF